MKYYICVVEEINRQFKNRIAKRREMMKIVTDQANKVEISEMVNQRMSVEGLRGHTSGGRVQGRRRKGNRGRWKKERRIGQNRSAEIVETGEPAWLLPPLPPDVHLGRGEHRGRKLREMWEAPPSVLPPFKRDLRRRGRVGATMR